MTNTAKWLRDAGAWADKVSPPEAKRFYAAAADLLAFQELIDEAIVFGEREYLIPLEWLDRARALRGQKP